MSLNEGPSTSGAATEELLILFGRVPRVGSDLISDIVARHGPQAAYRLQRLLLDTCVENANDLVVRKWFRYPSGSPAPTLPADWSARPHEPGTIGELVTLALTEGFERGFQRIVLFYADCPSLVPDILESAFEALEEGSDVVLGPTPKASLYLIGGTRKVGDLFATLPWRKGDVFATACSEVKKRKLRSTILPRMDSVETLEDWQKVASEGWLPPPPPVAGGTGRPEG